jgi:hypothetical protein
VGPQLPELQQYSSVLKTWHGLKHPPVVFNWLGQFAFTSAEQCAPAPLDPEAGTKFIGMLKPSTNEMSWKSKLLNWLSANSASVFGGDP